MLGGRSPRLVVATAVAVWSADLLALTLKQLVGRDRPFEAIPGLEPLMDASGYSMPSGHAATGFAALVVLSAAAPRLAPAFAVLAVATAFSRVYVGAHYLSDVIAGATLGLLVGVAVLRIRPLRSLGRDRSPRRPGPPPG